MISQKYAKQLRRQAERATRKMPDRKYQRNQRTGVIELTPDCTRGVYKAGKRAAK